MSTHVYTLTGVSANSVDVIIVRCLPRFGRLFSFSIHKLKSLELAHVHERLLVCLTPAAKSFVKIAEVQRQIGIVNTAFPAALKKEGASAKL